ncbi:aminoglycoside phosphotransferase family protein [Nocardia asteroides]|uniref:aminoglycoside phosphotransferase family protein n=1 Tax=Nocardia TaxID=1817 RepID=UPI00135C57DB|nr:MULTISPECIES: aminoglycoside phosphotransferase family protein [Nocardia]UAK35208.1 aminoglycoside phosphotransferase family protein [Nocardia asteroides]
MTAGIAGNGMRSILRAACVSVGIDASDAESLGMQGAYRLRDGIVVRIGGRGQKHATGREVAVARWLDTCGVSALRVVSDIPQPVVVEGCPVTFWHDLPPHRPGTPAEVARALGRLHRLPLPGFELRRMSPLARVEEQIAAARTVSEDDRRWLTKHLEELRGRWKALPKGMPWSVVQGGDWVDSVAVVAHDGDVILTGAGRAMIGPPEWDLVPAAIECWTAAEITVSQYADFCAGYGRDVMRWDGFYLLRDIQEFQMALRSMHAATADPAYQRQALRRLAYIRGDEGMRPWPGWADLD